MAPILAARVGVRQNTTTAVAFLPTSLSGLAVWLDAGQITGATDNTAVATWQDRSGNSRDVAQVTASKQPIYHSTGLTTPSGRPFVQFDGVDDFVLSATGNVPIHTGFMVMATSNTNNTIGFLTNYVDQTVDADIAFATILNSATIWDATTTPGGNGCYGSNIYRDGVLSGTLVNDGSWHVTSGFAAGTFTGTPQFPTGMVLGGDRPGSLSRYVAYRCAEIITYNRVLSTAERQQVEGWLKAKHGTP